MPGGPEGREGKIEKKSKAELVSMAIGAIEHSRKFDLEEIKDQAQAAIDALKALKENLDDFTAEFKAEMALVDLQKILLQHGHQEQAGVAGSIAEHIFFSDSTWMGDEEK